MILYNITTHNNQTLPDVEPFIFNLTVLELIRLGVVEDVFILQPDDEDVNDGDTKHDDLVSASSVELLFLCVICVVCILFTNILHTRIRNIFINAHRMQY